MNNPPLLFDTHAHYIDAAFDDDRHSLLDTLFARAKFPGIIEAGTNPQTSQPPPSLPSDLSIYGLRPACTRLTLQAICPTSTPLSLSSPIRNVLVVGKSDSTITIP